MLISFVLLILILVWCAQEKIALKLSLIGLAGLGIYLLFGLLLKALAAFWLPLLLVGGAYIAIFHK